MRVKASAVALALTVLATTVAFSPAAADGGHEKTSLFVTSFDGTQIDVNVCRPAGASAADPVPIVLGSHGWGGQKSGCNNGYLDAGLGWASMTQRGNGASGGQNNIMDPDLEGRDIVAVIDHLASLDWVLKDDGPGGVDPRIGMVGGSYGGGFQWIGAFTDQLWRDGPTRVDALAPGNTWHDLGTSLAPNGVIRSAITAGLYATGVQNMELAPWIHVAFAIGYGTGTMDRNLPGVGNYASEIQQHSAAWFVAHGERLDVPAYINQGAADILFNLNEGIHNFDRSLTPEARAASLFVGAQNGHGLPGQLPSGPLPYTATSGVSCAAPGKVTWFKHTLLGEPLDLEPRIRLSTVGKECVTLDDWVENTPFAVSGLDGAVLPAAARGEPTFTAVADGPLTLAGIPRLAFTATTTDPDARLFWGLAVGTSAEDARLIDRQWMPTRHRATVLDEAVDTELGGVVIDIADDETLFLVASPAADQYVAHATRGAAVVLVDDVVVDLPVVA